MVVSSKKRVFLVAEANPILESKDTALTQGDKCSKFSRPQIDLKTS
jgi:hypothetical protein